MVERAAWAMLVVLITGPLLAWPRLSQTLRGWHIGIGWILLPLVLLPVATDALRTPDVGELQLPQALVQGPELTVGEAVARAAQSVDISTLESARQRPNGVLLRTGQGAGAHAWLVTRDSVKAMGAGRNWLRDVHDGIWAPPYSGWVGLASAAALLGLLGTGCVAWGRRQLAGRRRESDAGADLLIAYASQTGRAARYASATAVAIREGAARVAIASLAALHPADLSQYRAALLVVSTTGEGQLAETGRSFMRALEGADLTGASFALFALGDRRYRSFCAGGASLRTALLQAGAKERQAMVCADGDPAVAWQTWLADLSGPLCFQLGRVARLERRT